MRFHGGGDVAVRKFLTGAAVILVSLLAGPLVAQDFSKGLEAAQRGDFVTALREWKPLAEQGYANAQYNLGVMYDTGRGAAQDYTKAVKWYHKAAAQGVAKAQYNLGFMYYKGRGVLQENVIAHMWFKLAAEQGNDGGAMVADQMTPSAIAEAQRLADECLARNYMNCGR
jgi:TPR repeat protein